MCKRKHIVVYFNEANSFGNNGNESKIKVRVSLSVSNSKKSIASYLHYCYLSTRGGEKAAAPAFENIPTKSGLRCSGFREHPDGVRIVVGMLGYQKKQNTRGGSRTLMPLLAHAPKACVSTISPPWPYMFLRNSLPIPDFKYFSRFLASGLVLCSST